VLTVYVRIGDLPDNPTFLQQARYRELAGTSSDELLAKVRALQAGNWDAEALKWHFGRHGPEVGVTAEVEYAALAEQVLRSPTRIFSEIYVDPLSVQQYGLTRLLPWEREQKIEQIVETLPRAWLFVDEGTGRVVVVSDAASIMTLYAHTVPEGITTFIHNRLRPEAIEVLIWSEADEEDENVQGVE
jgi:hypothetical protein